MLLLDLSHTAHTPARTGVQRVALEMRRALRSRDDLREITFDPHAKSWRSLQSWELNNLRQLPAAQGKRGASWPLRARLSGWLQRRRNPAAVTADLPTVCDGLIFPEIFTARTGAALPPLFAHVQAPKVAIFHDAIALRLPELTPPGNIARFPAYLDELRQFDGIAANSEDSRAALLDYWKWARWSDCPPVIALPLGCDHLSAGPSAMTTEGRPTVLSVGSIEGRKNHLRLLEACEQLWQSGIEFKLQLIGTLQRQTGRAAHDKVRALQSAGHPVEYQGWLPDAQLVQAYAHCAFTIYPSLMEGFGFPIWESLRNGKACICSDRGATAEAARDGACLMVDSRSVDALAGAMRKLLQEPNTLAELNQIARARGSRSPTWSAHAKGLIAWMAELPVTPHPA